MVLITHGNTAEKIMTSGIPVIMLTRFATREVAVVAKKQYALRCEQEQHKGPPLHHTAKVKDK